MSEQTVNELGATLLYAGAPDLMVKRCVTEWERWDYGCRVERFEVDRADVFKGGAFVLLRRSPGLPDLPWDELEQQAELVAGGPDTFDHAAALATARGCDHRIDVTVRILEPDPSVMLNELFITLNGLVSATSARAVWLPHSQALLTAEDFLTESEWLRLDETGGGARTPYSLYVAVQLRLPLERLDRPVGFTRGLAQFGWPEFEIEDAAAAPTSAAIFRTLVNGAMYQFRSKGRMGPGEHMITSTGRLRIGSRTRSLNFDGDVLPLRFLD